MAKYCGYCGRPLSGLTGRCAVCDERPPQETVCAPRLSAIKVVALCVAVTAVLAVAIVLTVGLTRKGPMEPGVYHVAFEVTDENEVPITQYDVAIVGVKEQPKESYAAEVSGETVQKNNGLWLPRGTYDITVTDRQSGCSKTVKRRVIENSRDDYGVELNTSAKTDTSVVDEAVTAAPTVEAPLADWVGKTFDEFIEVYGEEYYLADYWISAAAKPVVFNTADGRVFELYYIDESRSLPFNPHVMRIYGISCAVNDSTRHMIVEGDVLVGDTVNELYAKRAVQTEEMVDTTGVAHTYTSSGGLHVGFYNGESSDYICVSERGVFY